MKRTSSAILRIPMMQESDSDRRRTGIPIDIVQVVVDHKYGGHNLNVDESEGQCHAMLFPPPLYEQRADGAASSICNASGRVTLFQTRR